MENIKWIFFDVGSTLVDETEAYDHRIRDMIAGTNITYEQFDEQRIRLAKKGFNGDSEAIRYFGLAKTPWHSEDEIPYPDAEDTLKWLCQRGYKLGIIANQVPGTAERLGDWGLLSYFDVIAASAEIGAAKPDKAIFERAFELADCKAEEAAMVGDRLDNDILPAKKLGMKTVWIRKGLAVYQTPNEGEADASIETLSELKKIFV